MKNFITNSGAANLKRRLTDLIAKSDELKFLVGFFYFSGIRELYEGLKNNPDVVMKVLVGLNVDKGTYGFVEFSDSETNLSDEERTYRFFRSIERSLNTEDFDTAEFYEQVRYFIRQIQEDKLILRKTYNPNHSKIYIFKLDKDQIARQNLFITGSSNLTKAGLTTQEEFNVEISDFGCEDAETYFDSLWNEAVKITEDDVMKRRLIEVVEKKTLLNEPTPFEAFVLVLKTYLDSFEQKEIGQSLIKTLEDNGYTPYQYQLDAVKQALAIIEKNNGVIIADVVGLGKTIIACAVARELKKRGVVICPPGLIGDKNKNSGWKRYTEEFGLRDWEVRSIGDLENIAEFVNKARDIEIIIIDEAHRFRNQDTKDYEILKNICRNKIVILLTATPFNNRPRDILSLLKLFITPKKSTITLENNLVDRFKAFGGIFDRLAFIRKYFNSPDPLKKAKAQSYYEALFGEPHINLAKIKERSKYLAKQIRDVIEPVTIRRNRLDLQNNPFYKTEVKELSKVQPPQEWFFELTKEQSAFYDKVISDYFWVPDEGGRFKGAIYRPFEYEVEIEKLKRKDKLSEKENFQYVQQRELFDFMRRLLVKRFESSFGAFQQSIKNFKRITENVLKFIKKTDKYILDRSLLEKIHELDLEEIESHLANYAERIRSGDYPKSHKIYKLSEFRDKQGFIEDIQSDLVLFDCILKELQALELVKNDPKTTCLVTNVERILKNKPQKGEPQRKVVLFSEYADTVKYLEPALEKRFGKKVLTISGDLPSGKIAQINKNFDASFQNQEDKYDILLSTDKISEGFNLNRSGVIVNIDIPWNPVRVIQRLGRINRISKKVYEDLFIVNFFPSERGAELVKSREIASNKMFLIHNTLGEDSQIFDIDEEPSPAGLYERLQKNPDDLEQESFYTKALMEFLRIEKESPEVIEAIKKCPSRVKVAKRFTENELLVFLKKGRLYIHGLKYEDGESAQPYQAPFEDVFQKIICSKDENKLSLSEAFWPVYEELKKFKDHRITPLSEQSLEQKAINNLKTFIAKVNFEALMPYKDFLRILLEDILDYGTLSDYTLRRISNFEYGDDAKQKRTISEIQSIHKELGDDYLEKEKLRQKDITKEIIIAIENQKA